MKPLFERLRHTPIRLPVRGMLLAAASRLHLIALSMLLVVFFEYLNRGGYGMTGLWMVTRPLPFALNILLVLSLLLLFIGLIGRTWPAFLLLSVILMVIGFVSGIKKKILGVPLLPWDLVLSKETQDMTAYVSGIVDAALLTAVVGFAAGVFALFRYVPTFRSKFRWIERAVMLAVALFIGYTAYSDKPIALLDRFHIVNTTFNQTYNYEQNGFLVGTILNIDSVIIPKPDNYNDRTIRQIADGVPHRNAADPSVKPNVIVVLSEAFWDPTLLPGVSFDRDPAPTLHMLQQFYPNGYMISPQYGGGTANVEFEVLSGNSMRFAPPGSTPYIQYVNRGIDSLASIFSRKAYAATAINPLDNWFFNSKTVYKNFGFDRYVSMEFFEQKKKGYYIEDAQVAKTIIETTERSAGPDFVFANTMENHYPFVKGKFEHNEIAVTANVSEKAMQALEAYATGVYDADKMLKTLIDYYGAKGEPTIVCFFGDHKPALTDNYGVFYETGFLQKNDPDAFRKIYSTPVVVWDNYLPAHRDNLDISASFLGPYLLELAKMEGTPYTDFLYDLSQKHPVVPHDNLYGEYGITAEELLPYKLLQYDMMFGEQYAIRDRRDKIVKPGYQLGYGPMTIRDVSPERLTAGNPLDASGGDSTLAVSGGPFVPSSVVYVNGKAMTTKLQPDGVLHAQLPAGVFKKAGKLTVEVKVVDSQKIVVSGSNKVELDVKGK